MQPEQLAALLQKLVLGGVSFIVLMAIFIIGATYAPVVTALAFGCYGGLMMVLFAMVLIPRVVDSLTNRPNRFKPVVGPVDESPRTYNASTFGFFTYLEPGRVKIIERGRTFVRAIMHYSGHNFVGERTDNDLRPHNPGYWKVVESETYPDSHPLPFPGHKLGWYFFVWLLYSPFSIVWWVWKRWVYLVTGAVFTGFSPFQTVRTYPIERFKEITQPNGDVILSRIEDYSDHYRVAQFLYTVIIPSADTKDKTPVKVHLDEVVRVINPYETAYNTDNDWARRLLASLSNSVTTFTRSRPLDDVLSAVSGHQATELEEAVTSDTQASVGTFGMAIDETLVRDISTANPEDAEAYQDEARAKVERRAREERAKGEAGAITSIADAMAKNPEQASLAARIEGVVRAAEAAGKNGGIVVLGGTQAIDPMGAGIYRELRNQNQGNP